MKICNVCEGVGKCPKCREAGVIPTRAEQFELQQKINRAREHGDCTMKIKQYVFVLLVAGHLAGCTVTPVPAHKLFGTSNPTAVVCTPEGTFKMPTTMQSRYIITKNPNGTSKFDLTLKSDPVGVVKAEGDRAEQLMPGIQANIGWATAATQMNHQTADKVIDRAFNLAEAALPIIAAQIAKPPTDPNTNQIDALELKLKNMFDTERGNLLLQMQALIEANKKTDDEPSLNP